MHLVSIVSFLVSPMYLSLAAGQQCKPSEVSAKGKALKGHTFKAVVVSRPFECQILCEKELKCQSYNFFIPKKICELNNMTKEARPNDYVTDENRFYMGIWRIRDLKSCKELHDVFKSNESQLVTLNLESKPILVHCHVGDFGCGLGGWTPVMKIKGKKNTFHYNSTLWSNKNTFNLAGGETGFDFIQTKLPTYWNTPFSKICLGMRFGPEINFIVINKTASSFYFLIADGHYHATTLGRDTWKSLIGTKASLQTNCNKEGFNVMSGQDAGAKARTGILGNNEEDCVYCESSIGFGTRGSWDNPNTCGNEARSDSSDNGKKNIIRMCYILVQ